MERVVRRREGRARRGGRCRVRWERGEVVVLVVVEVGRERKRRGERRRGVMEWCEKRGRRGGGRWSGMFDWVGEGEGDCD